jgi:diguanylate cyclase (GGDEF)-like protein
MKRILNVIKKMEEAALRVGTRVPLVQTIMQRQYRLKTFVGVSTLVVSIISFNLVFLLTYSLYQGIVVNQARVVSRSISRQTFNMLFQLMEKGWTRKELEAQLGSMGAAPDGTAYQVKLYRKESNDADDQVRGVLNGGGSINAKTGSLLTDIYPVMANKRCLTCHTKVQEGDILAAVSVQQDIGPAITEIRHKFILFFLILFLVPFILAGAIAIFLSAKINSSTELFHNKIKAVSSVKDLTRLEMDGSDIGFIELNNILQDLGDFAKRIKEVAVDREILEFELRVLEKFIITSEVVKDWKEHVQRLLLEINKVIEAYTLFSVFQIDEEVFDLQVFWKGKPSDKLKGIVEKIVRQKVANINERFAHAATVKIHHNVADPSNLLSDLAEHDIEMQTKSLILQNPQIGGVVGIGVQSQQTGGEADAIRSLVIDGILTTLLNVVGSIKAIYKYTKDLEYYATRDPLTNLYNQRLFWELLGYEISRAERHGYKFAVLVIDLDNFKNINDSHGHVFGDRFLSEIAKEAHQALRNGDILARYGGDEFVVILPEADEEQAYSIANRIRENIGGISLSTHDDTKVKATVSIGMAVFPVHAANAKDLFVFADNMMYRAKSEGKDRILIPTAEDVVEVFRSAGEMTLLVMKVIEEKSVIPYFQPIVNVETGRVECHEILSRIKTDKGILAAGEFIEVAERLGVVSKLDYVIMEKAFEKVQAEGYDRLLFINLSPKSLILREFIPTVLQLTDRYGIDHSSIVFEITERDTVKNISLLEKFVRDLKLEGFNFAIDDFGSGFSSFHYIKRFPIDYVKIEGEFIRNMLADSKDLALVKTMAVLCREFGIKTIAEYVENEEILQALKQIGIGFGQGYHTGRPSPDLMPGSHPLEQ